jgi:hypothetical protein
VFLLLALAIAAVSHKNRTAYFRSPAPWVAALAVLVCAPHAAWLVQESFPPTKYVAGTRAAQSLADWLRSVTEYVFGTWTYAGIAVIVVLVAVRPSLAAILDTLWPADPQRRTAAMLFWLPLLLPLPAAAITGTRLLSLWSMPALGLLPVVMLMSPLIVVPRRAVVHTAAIAMAVAVGALIAAPLYAWWQLAGTPPSRQLSAPPGRGACSRMEADDVAAAQIRRGSVRACQSGVVLSARAPVDLLSARLSAAQPQALHVVSRAMGGSGEPRTRRGCARLSEQ